MGNASVFGGARMTVPSTLKPVVPLNDNDWETIKMVADLGVGANYWAVGDTKEVTLNGTVGALTFSNVTYCCFIIGFDHNESREGKGIHFQLGKTALSGGKDIGFKGETKMQNTTINKGGWEGSIMRTSTCATFFECLPSDLQSVIAACTKYTDNTGGGSDSASYVTATEDPIWLLSEYEVFGARTRANSAEKNYQNQYDYYSAGNSKIKYNHNSQSTAGYWWLRSPSANYTFAYCSVTGSGTASHSGAGNGEMFSPAFKVGG